MKPPVLAPPWQGGPMMLNRDKRPVTAHSPNYSRYHCARCGIDVVAHAFVTGHEWEPCMRIGCSGNH